MAGNKRNKYGNLQDMIDVELTGSSQQLFYNYKKKNEIGRNIFIELYKRFNNSPAEGPIGFCMDDGREVGLLSQCQSLQALLLLASDFDLSFDDANIISEDETNLTIRQIMDIVIDDVLKRIKTKQKGIYRFDASPYETKLFTVEFSNVEAITWVIPSFLQALKYHAQIGETCMWEEELVDVIRYGLRYINDAFIDSADVGTSDKLEIGWNFTKNCEEPSLFYSFTVCECFVDFFETFEDYLSYREAERANNLYGSKRPMSKKMEEQFKKHMRNYQVQLAAGDRGVDSKTGKKLAQFDEYHELRLRYTAINGGNEAIEGTEYGRLEANCKKVASEIWRLSKAQLADTFFYNDLHTTLTEEDISMATTSDALFNTVYIINIMLDAGLDEDMQLAHDVASTDAEMEATMQEYNNLLEACQLASQRTFRAYEKLKVIGKDYIVDQFLIGFNERFDRHKDLVKELRKRRMRVFTLMPLLIRTNNAISDYLIKYPQHNMRKYLGYILENRYEESGKSRWIWEKDGYFSCSNYYYVSALGEFYAYYDKYESKYITIDTENEIQRQKIIAEYDAELRARTGDIGKLEREINERDNKIVRLEKQLANVQTPVEDAVTDVVNRELQKAVPSLICQFINGAAAGLMVQDIDATAATDTQKQFADAMSNFVFAMLSQNIYKQVQSKNALKTVPASKEELEKDYYALSAKIKSDFSRIIKAYIAEISNHQFGESSWYRDNRNFRNDSDNN